MLLYALRSTRKKRPTQPVKKISSYKKYKADTLLTDLPEALWGVMDVFDSIDERWDYWKTLFMDIANKHVPLIKINNGEDEVVIALKRLNVHKSTRVDGVSSHLLLKPLHST